MHSVAEDCELLKMVGNCMKPKSTFTVLQRKVVNPTIETGNVNSKLNEIFMIICTIENSLKKRETRIFFFD